MATPATQLSLEHQLLERLRFSGMDRDNLADLVTIAVGLRNKYGFSPVGVTAVGTPVPDRIVIRYLIEGIIVSKLSNILLDTPRLATVNIRPHGLPLVSKFEVSITLGG
jgi:hypothetical protein